MDTQKIYYLSEEVVKFAQSKIVVKLRFMDTAISLLSLAASEDDNFSFGTDARKIQYDPISVLKMYKKDKNLVVHTYLHSVIHCIFKHFLCSSTTNLEIWNLCCDMATEAVIDEIQMSETNVAVSPDIRKQLDKYKQKAGMLTAEKLYRYFMDADVSEKEIEKLKDLFAFDNHSLWYNFDSNEPDSDDESDKQENETGDDNSDSNDEKNEKETGDDESDSNNEDNKEESGDNETDEENEEGSGEGNEGESSGDTKDSSDNTDSDTIDDRAQGDSGAENEYDYRSDKDISSDKLSALWQDVSDKMQVDLENFSKQHGSESGSLMQNLREVNRERYDYTEFLKKFSVMGERIKVNEDEFDYIFYTYGLDLYENMPLVEPLEYSDVKQIRDFVIAIDTSGSTSYQLVHKFLKKTYNIFDQQQNFFNRFNVHIIQCDTEIQEDAKITCKEEFDQYLSEMKIRGMGGTDFRPVFSYVNKLIETGELNNLKGLIYFTDGYGYFPQNKPGYETAFVFIDDGYNNYNVPVWAIKLILSSDDI